MRIDRHRVALRRWGLEEYSGIAEEMGQAIDRAGGRIETEALVQQIMTQFDSREQSVRMYLNAPMFVVEGHLIRRRKTEDGFHIESSLTDVADCYLVASHRLNFRIRITADILRGSGFHIPEAIANWLGVVPGTRQYLQFRSNRVLVSWPITALAGPTLGSIRDGISEEGCKAGEQLLLCFANDEMTLDVLPVPKKDLELAKGTKRLALLTGLPFTDDPVKDRRLLRTALGLERSTQSVSNALRSRGEHDLADHIYQETSAELDEAIEQLGDLL